MTPEAAACPLCRQGDLRVHFDAQEHSLTAETFGSSRKQFSHGQILRCRCCRFSFSRVRPSSDELGHLYQAMDVQVYESETAGRWKTSARHFDILSRFVPVGALLDVGCASGMFMSRAAANGWSVVGIEPSVRLCRLAEDRLGPSGRVLCTTLQEAPLEKETFSAVTLWDVLEHVSDPVEFLALCANLVRPSGYVVVNVPDIESIQARLLGRRWPLLLPEHLNYFNRSSLELCAGRAGLKAVHFGRRPASFSLGYVAHRLSQHGIAGTRFAARALEATRFARLAFPVWMGEIYCVLRREG